MSQFPQNFPPVYLTELRACQSHSSLDIVPQILVGVKVLSRQADYDAFEVICILSLKFVLFNCVYDVYLNSCVMMCLYIFQQYKVGPHGLVSTPSKIKIPCLFLLIFVYRPKTWGETSILMYTHYYMKKLKYTYTVINRAGTKSWKISLSTYLIEVVI